MKLLFYMLIVLMVSHPLMSEQVAQPTSSGGDVTFTDRQGKVNTIHIDRQVADLWVAPDESVIAFITMDKVKPADRLIKPLIEESSLYVAKKTEGFKPVRLNDQSVIEGRVWKLAREPKVSSDRRTVYFLVPDTMALGSLMSIHFPPTSYRAAEKPKKLADVQDYCIVWGGRYSGGLVILTRREPLNSVSELTFPCLLRETSGKEIAIANECFAAFDTIVAKWLSDWGGECH